MPTTITQRARPSAKSMPSETYRERKQRRIYGKLGGRGMSSDVRNKDQGQVAGKRF
jgi:hypothetical protein